MRDLQGQVVLITGASRGIGRALSVALVAAGADVYGCARDADALRETGAQCVGPGAFSSAVADVTDFEAIKRLVERIGAERGRLDILVNNAAVLGPRKLIEEVELSEWQKTQSVNVDGVFIVSKLSLPLLRRAGDAMMLNVSSSVGRLGRGGWGPYGVSKHAVEGITETLADELHDDGICVVSVNPGGTATDMRQEAYPAEDPDTLPGAPEIAQTFRLLIEFLTIEQTGQKYDSRSLLRFVGQPGLDAASLPSASQA